MEQKPVIFLAFANDRASYLRNLRIECRGIQKVLEKAITAGLCEVVVRTDAAIEDILDVFQDRTCKDRIAVFHYSGHADDYALILQTFAGKPSPAYREGLVSFFARQKGLKLIFLNGCSTEQHARELKKAGLAAVIGTSGAIDDKVAMKLAIRFYNGIANGSALERAWKDAEDGIKIQKNLSDLSALYCVHKTGHKDRFPWNILFKEGAEKVKNWNLPDAANDPLFALPPIPRNYQLPDKPFLFLNRYKRKHAEIFFGRSYYIRELFNRVTDKKSPPIILLYGQTGVGKSSLLEAGLLPRIEESHTVLYTRRNREKGLLGTLEEALVKNYKLQNTNCKQITNNNVQNYKQKINKKLLWGVQGGGFLEKSLPGQWKEIEAQTGKPLVIIMDQVEEVYTRLNKKLPHELEDFSQALRTVFGNPMIYPAGKFILGYRKEYHPEIEEKLKNNELDRTCLFLQPLSCRDIVEVVTGLTRSKPLKDKYNLSVEKQLPDTVAENLLEDKDSPAAPALQIVLTKMWDASKKDELSTIRKFTVEQYRCLKREGLLMEDFFKQQMEKMGNWKKEVIDSGLALDVLKFHTTELSTVCSRNIKDIRQSYQHKRDIIVELVKRLKDVYLLTDAQRNKEETSLAHDTLAPIVIKKYNNSDKPGQRAARILSARIEDFKKNSNEIWLNEADLSIVEQGKNGMRALNPVEEELLEKSREQRARREKLIKRYKKIRLVSIISIMILAALAIFILWQSKVASYEDRIRKINKANYLVSLAQEKVEKDPTIALGLAEAAWNLDKNDIVKRTLGKIYHENNFYRIIAKQNKKVTCAVFSPDGRYILTGSGDTTVRLWDLKGNELQVFRGHKGSVTCTAFSPGGQFIITASLDTTARLWNLEGNELRVFNGHEGSINSAAFSPDNRYILTSSGDKTARWWHLKRNEFGVFKEHKHSVTSAAFSPDRQYILTASGDTVRLWDLEGNELRNFKGNDYIIHSLAFSPDGQYIVTGADNGCVRLWNSQGKELQAFIGHGERVSSVTFSPGGKYILTGSRDKTAGLFDLEGNKLRVFKGHNGPIHSAVFSPDGQYILTGSQDKTVRLWKISILPLKDFLKKGLFEPLSKKQKREYGIEYE